MPLNHSQSMSFTLDTANKRHRFFPLRTEGTTEVKHWLAETICGRNPYKIFASLPKELEEEVAVKNMLDRCTLNGAGLHGKSRQELERELRKMGLDRLLALSLTVKIEDLRTPPSNRCSDPIPKPIPEFNYLGPTNCPIPSSTLRDHFISSSPGQDANAARMRLWLLSWFKHADIKGTRGDRWMRTEIHCAGDDVRGLLVKLVHVGGSSSLTCFFLGCGFGEEVAACLARDVGRAVIAWR